MPKEGQVQHVEPDDRLVALVAMVVPVPCRCHNHISSDKRHLLALNRSEAFTVHDEATGERNVPVRWSNLTGVHDLKPAVDCVRGVGGFCGICE